MTLDAEDTQVAGRAAQNGQAPRCDHLDMLMVVERGLPQCKECLVLGWTWALLLACRTCGWVACCDDSPGNHAQAHYLETDHPVVSSITEGSSWRWCYVHGRIV